MPDLTFACAVRSAAIASALACLATAGQAAESAGPWSETFWNPVPMADDLVVPLPCGGSLALRPVQTELPNNWLDDRRLQLGTVSSEQPHTDYVHTTFIAGSLSEDGSPGRRLYYIGKYEVTDDQWAAVMDDVCPSPRMRGRLPKGDASWFDAVEFTRRLSNWIFQNSPGSLPQEDGVRAYIRLPTESEWEFAARGGMAVSEDAFRAAQPENLEAQAWFQGASSCDGDVQVVGLRAPNPLGLFDVLGNVQELVLDPFHLNRAGREHGQPGGFVARGGSCSTSALLMTQALRIEYPYFSELQGGEMRPDHTGFRVVLAAPVITSNVRVAAIREDWDRVLALRTVPDGDEDPLTTLADLTEEADDPVLRDGLTTVATRLRAELGNRAEIEGRAVENAIQAGANIIRQYRDDRRQLERLELTRSIAPQERHGELDDAIARQQTSIGVTERVYAAVLTATAEDYPGEMIDDRLRIVQAQLDAIDASAMVCFARLFVDHTERIRLRRVGDFRTLFDNLITGC